jgi:hypothetical protein
MFWRAESINSFPPVLYIFGISAGIRKGRNLATHGRKDLIEEGIMPVVNGSFGFIHQTGL